jgi:hypothetical protein
MDRLESILFVVLGITGSVVLGLLWEAAEERVRIWLRARKYGGNKD